MSEENTSQNGTHSQNTGSVIRVYIDGKWQDCVVSVRDEASNGTAWLEADVKYYDGHNWIHCSF